ncbi:MAG: thioredoxin family protein [bacterium]|nr:thioredoxin family protein [bacterium]
MNCPHCNMYTSDSSSTCENCGKEVGNTGPAPVGFQQQPMANRAKSPTSILLLLVIIIGLAVVGYFVLTKKEGGETSHAMNAKNPGAELDVEDYIKEGKTTIVDFYSEFCPPCRKISPLLKRLDAKREDIVVIKLDLNRKGKRGIDWQSPLTQQYGIRSIPYFQIYDEEGELLHAGRNAAQEVYKLLREEGIN